METDQSSPQDADALPPPETILVTDHRVSCNGDGGALGHPRVFYEIGEEGFVDCLYCDRRFALKHP
ncbi:MAG: zinc-finger domain-containing protein [Hyphomonadaceae bacterium]